MEIYNKGIAISRNYKKRSSEDTKELNEIILSAIEIVQNKESKFEEKAIQTALSFLITLYEPLIKNLSYSIHSQFKHVVEYEDVFQEAHTIFISLVYKYRIGVIVFSWFVNYFLSHLLYEWGKKTFKHAHTPIDFSENIDESGNGSFSSILDTTIVFFQDEFDAYILEQEFTKFIMARATKKSRSDTNKIVCDQYFLGHKSCSTIAKEQKISYQAVYEIIKKIKGDLLEYLTNNKFTGPASDD